MTPNERGRHCDNCNKTVIDFSLYSDKELFEFFKNIPNGVCGHIPSYQLNRVIAVQDKSRYSFLRKFAWVTAIATWLGLADKADAQTTTKQTTEKVASKKARKQTTAQADSIKNSITLSFYDASSKKPIPEVNIVMSINNDLKCFTAVNGVYRIELTPEMMDKKIVFSCSGTNYDSKEFLVTPSHLPIHKKVYLKFAPVRSMVNGGLVAHPQTP